jgi:hypothetical protein
MLLFIIAFCIAAPVLLGRYIAERGARAVMPNQLDIARRETRRRDFVQIGRENVRAHIARTEQR